VSGVYFREETAENSGNRNTFRNNKVLDNGTAGFYIAKRVTGTLLTGNEIRDAHGRSIYKAEGAGSVRLENNTIDGHTPVTEPRP
jgi:parallel beta-helix repeat protein